MADTSFIWLVLGVVLVVVGATLMWEFVFEFLKLIVGLVLIIVGAQFISVSRRPRARVRKK